MSFAPTPGRGGQPRVVATHAASGARLEVYLHGATVTSFTHAGQDLFFVSELAVRVIDISRLRGSTTRAAY